MLRVRYGGKTGKQFTLAESDQLVAVRTQDRNAVMDIRPFEIAPVSERARSILEQFELSVSFRDAGVAA